MQNHKTVEIQRLRGIAENEAESPEERIRAASRLLAKFGPTDRNIPFINKVIRLFSKDADYNIKESALKLKRRFEKARGLKEIEKLDVPEEVTPQALTVETPSTENVVPAISETKTAVAFGPAPIVPKPIYPPTNVVFPSPSGIYQLGRIDFDAVVDRLRNANALSQFPPDVGKDRDNEEFLRIALGLSPTQPVTHAIIQQLSYAFEYEPRRDDEFLSRGERNDYTTLMTFLHHAMFYYAHSTFGCDSLKHAPRNPNASRSFLDEIRERSA